MSAPGFLPVFYNETMSWIIFILFFAAIIKIKKTYNPPKILLLQLYILWLSLSIIRGIIIADGYWEYKSLIKYSFSLFIPFSIYAFEQPYFLQQVLKKWLKIVIPLFIVIFFFILSDSFFFFYAPIYLLILFYPYLPIKWKIIFLSLIVFILLWDLTARSPMVKSIVTLVFISIYKFKHLVKKKILNILQYIFYLIPIILLILGISGIFNIFKIQEEFSDSAKQSVQSIDKGLIEDSRSFIYINVITSAIEHNYVLWGRTPARGNDDKINGEIKGNLKFIREYNEVCHPNIFTWLGLIGLTLFSLMYFQASYKAINHSKNRIVKIIGLYVAFHWMYGWVEDTYVFNMMTVTNWMLIGICYSPHFRNMNEIEIKQFTQNIFK